MTPTYHTLMDAPLSPDCDARVIVTRRPLTAAEWDRLTAYLAAIRDGVAGDPAV